MRRPSVILAALALAGPLLATASAPPASAIVEERWCSLVAAPCFESLTIDGTPIAPADPIDPSIDSAPWVDPDGFYQQMDWALAGDLTSLQESDDVVAVINTGATFVTDRLQYGNFVMNDIDTSVAGGDHLITVTGSPVLYAEGCDSANWPPVCPPNATSEYLAFRGTLTWVTDPGDPVNGDWHATNANYNGIFFDRRTDGSGYFTTDVWSPHFESDETTARVGFARFRVSYGSMRSEMNIPTPHTLLPGSFTGVINGTERPSAFRIWHDPDGGGMMIEVSGFTFSTKRIKVIATTITPKRPRMVRTDRVSGRRATLVHTEAKPRGARVTGYRARCTAGRDVVRGRADADTRRVQIRGLRARRGYDCRVRALSKAGPSRWSTTMRVPRR